MAGKIQADEATDGRRARRERGRVAVSDAMVDLVFEGHDPPTADQVAHRAGVSVASLFRYFATLDDLRDRTIERYFDRYAHLFEIPRIGDGPLTDRIDRYLIARLDLYETTAPMARLVRHKAHDHTVLSENLQRIRATGSDQLRLHFDLELGALGRAQQDDAVGVLNTVTSFESWDQIRITDGRSRDQIRRAWTAAFTSLLAGP